MVPNKARPAGLASAFSACIVACCLVAIGHGDALAQVPSFARQETFTIENYGFYSAAIGDLNGDGVNDLVFSQDVYEGEFGQRFVPRFGVSLGVGNGRLAAPALYEGLGNGIALGDLNGDGRLDVVGGGIALSVALNNGDGTFAAAQRFTQPEPASNYRVRHVAVFDLNSDGKADVVATELRPPSIPGRVSIFRGNGDGTLGPRDDAFAPGPYISALKVGDFNRDDRVDIALLLNRRHALVYAMGNGAGGFSAPIVLELGNQASSGDYGPPEMLAVGDLNGDGADDAVVGNINDHTVTVLLSRGDGTFGPDVDYQLIRPENGCTPRMFSTCGEPHGVQVADFDADGDRDIVVLNRWDTELALLANDGGGQFTLPVLYRPQLPPAPLSSGGTYPVLLSTGRLNDDNRDDVVFFFGRFIDGVALSSWFALINLPVAPLQWTQTVNSSVDNGSLRKSGGCDGCFDAHAVSSETLTVGDGGLSARVFGPGLRAIGLTRTTAPATLDALDFSFYIANGLAEARHKGVWRSDVVYNDGDLLRITLQNGEVQYDRNGIVFYREAVSMQYPYRVSGILAASSASLADVRIIGSQVSNPNASLVTNGDFTNGSTGWATWPPDAGSLVADASGGEMRFYRPAGSTQGSVLQATGTAFGAGASFDLQFALGNSDAVRKRLTVIVHDADWSDFAFCSFWLSPSQPRAAYVVRANTTQAWTNATVAFYAASVNTSGSNGAYVLDDVSLIASAEAPGTTQCLDPASPNGESPELPQNMLLNGTFDDPSLAPWVRWASLQWQHRTEGSNGMLELFAQAAGDAVLQSTLQPVEAGTRLTTTFRLGNASGVRQRVTVIIHDADFNDLAACSFWLEPGRALQPFSMRAYSTTRWANTTLSLYPATPGAISTHAWLQLDDVVLRRTSALTPGSICASGGG